MKTIELALSKRYQVGNKTYLAGEQYMLTDDLADMLLSRRNERDMPYFVRVEGAENVEEETPAKAEKPKAVAKKAAPKKRAARKKATKPAGKEPSVSV